MPEHISSHFNQELEDVRTDVMRMGGLVEQQLQTLLKALASADGLNLTTVIDGDAVNDNFAKAARNIVGVNVLPAVGANVYDILKHDTLVLTRAAVEKLEARFNG